MREIFKKKKIYKFEELEEKAQYKTIINQCVDIFSDYEFFENGKMYIE